MGIKIRSLSEEDVIEVSYLDELSGNGVACMIDCEEYAWGIFVDKKLVGYCTIGGADVGDYDEEAEWTDDSLLLSDVFILSEYRGNGYAKLLVNEALNLANPDNESVFLKVLDDRLAYLYGSLGFQYLHDGTMVKTVPSSEFLAFQFIKQPESFGYRVVGEVYEQTGPFEWAEHDWNNDDDVYSQKIAVFHKTTNVNKYANEKFYLSKNDFNELKREGCIEFVKPEFSLESRIQSAEERVKQDDSISRLHVKELVAER